MEKTNFQTITGRRLRLDSLDDVEHEFLSDVLRHYDEEPEWSAFGSWWTAAFRGHGLDTDSVLYRLCQDLEARLGIAQGKVAPPDYRDALADLIEAQYGSRNRFCQETGMDPGHLSRVLAGRSELSLQKLQELLHQLHASLVVQSEEEADERVSPETARQSLALAV